MKNHTVIVLLLLLMPCFAVGQDLPRSLDGRRNMPMDFDLIHAGSMCLLLSARVEAGAFLDDLKVHKKHGQRTFRVGSKDEKSFPEHLILLLDGFLHRCEPREKGKYLDNLRLDSNFLTSLQFKVFWKRGFDMRTADFKIEQQAERGDGDFPNLPSSIEVWQYELSITSPDVPLTDGLVLLILDPDGKEICRLSGRL